MISEKEFSKEEWEEVLVIIKREVNNDHHRLIAANSDIKLAFLENDYDSAIRQMTKLDRLLICRCEIYNSRVKRKSFRNFKLVLEPDGWFSLQPLNYKTP